MIDYIKGQLTVKEPNRAVIEANGVGYELFIPYSTFAKLPSTDNIVKLLTHLVHRELAMELFGFASSLERKLFRKLISVSGIGPKIALATLSGMDAGEFINSISSEKITHITKIKGIGKKTAERLIVELRDKVKDIASDEISIPVTNKDEALQVLITLGYKEPDAQKAIAIVVKSNPNLTTEEIVKFSLREF